MNKDFFKKVGNGILTGLNYFFAAFYYMFFGIGWVFKNIYKGISVALVFVGKYIHLFLTKCIWRLLNAIWNFLKKLFDKARTGLGKLFSKIKKEKHGELHELEDKQSAFSKFMSAKFTYRKRQAMWGYIFILPLIIGFIYFFLFPFITTIVFSFSNVYRAGIMRETNETIGVVTEYVGMDNYKFIWNVHSTFKDTLGNVFVDTIVNVLMILIFSLIIAVVLNSKFRGRSFVRAIFFMPVIFNSQAVDLAMSTGQALTDAMEESGQDIFSTMFNFSDFLTNANVPVFAVNFLSNASKSIFDVISYSGVQILIFLSGIQSVPKHLYEAAKIEGATQYEIFWKITFPMVSPLMLTAGVYTVVDSFLRSDLLKLMNKYGLAGDVTYTLGLGNLTNDGIYAAMSILFCLVSLAVVIIVLLAIRKLVFYRDE